MAVHGRVDDYNEALKQLERITTSRLDPRVEASQEL